MLTLKYIKNVLKQICNKFDGSEEFIKNERDMFL